MDSPIYHLEKVVKARAEALEDFTGPLDLILHLLSKNKMEIKDIQISVILEQYLTCLLYTSRDPQLFGCMSGSPVEQKDPGKDRCEGGP